MTDETKARLQDAAEIERRSMSDQAEVFIIQALDAWEKARAARDAKR
jgi:hypothetical protein